MADDYWDKTYAVIKPRLSICNAAEITLTGSVWEPTRSIEAVFNVGEYLEGISRVEQVYFGLVVAGGFRQDWLFEGIGEFCGMFSKE